MSRILLNKLPLILKTVFILGTLTVLTYTITISTSKISSVTGAYYDSVMYSEASEGLALSAKQTTKKPFEPIKPRDPKAIKLERYLTLQQSELADHADLIVELSNAYGIDYRLPVAIAGAESGYCNKNSFDNNCWGYGTVSWPTLEAGIRGYLSKMNVGYFRKGWNTLETIAPVYNTVNTEGFIEKVQYHYDKIP